MATKKKAAAKEATAPASVTAEEAVELRERAHAALASADEARARARRVLELVNVLDDDDPATTSALDGIRDRRNAKQHLRGNLDVDGVKLSREAHDDELDEAEATLTAALRAELDDLAAKL